MIDSIDLKEVANFDRNGIQLFGLNKVNFIYGVNASGKTTISNFIADENSHIYEKCDIKWKHDQSLKTLVYNRNFRDRNFSGNSKLEGIFTLGEASQDEIDRITEKNKELTSIKAEGNQQIETLKKQQEKETNIEKEFKEACWKYYKKYEADFKEAFKRESRSKVIFNDKLIFESKNNSSQLYKIEVLKEKAKTIFGEPPKTITRIPEISFDPITIIEEDQIWGKKIIGKLDVDISQLIQNLNMNDWVNQGRDYLQENDTCPFCQQETITKEFRQQIENYFDKSFTESINQIKKYQENYSLLTSNLENELLQIELKEKEIPDSKLNVDKFSVNVKTILSQLSINKEYIQNKGKEPSRSFDIVDTIIQFQIIQSIISEANTEIDRHNNIVKNYQREHAKLINEVWRFVVEDARNILSQYDISLSGLQKGISNIKKEIEDKRTKCRLLDNEIKELTKNVTSTQPTVDEINKTLKYFGFNSFKLVPSSSDKRFYQIQREDRTLVESTLSEGEITFITFLYFLQLTKGATNEEGITEDRILVIDDPISSLDSNVLFVVSTLIKEIIEDVKNDKNNIKQIFILTHNVYFHKEVSFINGRSSENANTYHWILRKNKTTSIIQPYEMKNPIKSSYELLWQEFLNRDENSGIAIQNTMRRIIEYYFKILGKLGDENLIKKFDSSEEQNICRSLISWINDGSHGFPDDLYIEIQDDTIEKYLTVFKAIFEKTQNIGHYNMMMGIEN